MSPADWHHPDVLGPQTLGPRSTVRGMDDGSHPEGIDTGLQGPSHVRAEWLEGERLMAERKEADKRRSAAAHVESTRQRMDLAQHRIAQAELEIKHDFNPFGRGRRHAEQEIVIARARRDLVDWTEEHAEAVKKAKALGAE